MELSFSLLYVQDESEGVQLTVLTDRSQGGTSLRDGEMELMVSHGWVSHFVTCTHAAIFLYGAVPNVTLSVERQGINMRVSVECDWLFALYNLSKQCICNYEQAMAKLVHKFICLATFIVDVLFPYVCFIRKRKHRQQMWLDRWIYELTCITCSNYNPFCGWPTTYTTCTYTFTWDLSLIQTEIVQQVTFAVSIPNAWKTIDELVPESLQPRASKTFCASVREVDWCKSHLYIVFGSRVMKIWRILK